MRLHKTNIESRKSTIVNLVLIQMNEGKIILFGQAKEQVIFVDQTHFQQNLTELLAGSFSADFACLLEFIVAYRRASENLAIFANMRGDSPEAIAGRMRSQRVIHGLQGPTISRIVSESGGGWYAAHIVVRKDQMAQAIRELRAIGGSGVVVTPVTYIFEEEPEAYKAMLAALEE